MELLLTVERFQGQSPPAPMSQTFELDGGTIGRLGSNNWVLPDPSRFISSKHAQIHFNGNHFCITDLSTNGTFVNSLDAPMGRNNVVPLSDGDRIFIGEYEVAVAIRAGEATQDNSPMLDTGLEPPPPEPLLSAADSSAASVEMDDWFAQPGGSAADEFLQPAVPEPAAVDPIATPQTPEQEFFVPPGGVAGGDNHIPDDWDALLSGVMVGPQFDSAAPAPLPEPAAPPKSADAHAAPQPIVPPQPAMAPSAPITPPAMAVPASSMPKPVPAAPKPAPVKPDRAETPVATGASDSARAAILQGLRTQNIANQISTEQLSLEVASAVRLLTEGMMEVLAARTSTKDEFRLSQTRIGPAMNNPLKFSPSADEALQRMFSDDDRGFLRAQEAFQQALNDVKAHQVALLAGMQAGLNAILKYFAPGNLEKQIGQYASIASKVPGVREAKLWNQFNSLYDRIAKDAESDFQKLFSHEFAEAYENQIRSLLSARSKSNDSSSS